MKTLLIAWVAIRELIFERVFYLFLGFAGLALCLSLLLGQMTYTDKTKLTIDFMLAAMQGVLVLFGVFMGISLFQRELKEGTISLLLSKPIARGQVLLGKFLGQAAVAFILCGLMLAILWFTCRLFNPQTAVGPLFQASLALFFESLIMMAVCYFFAVQSGALTSVLSTLLIFILGHLREPLSAILPKEVVEGWIWRSTLTFFPNLEAFNLKGFASYGFSTGSYEMLLIFSYFLVVVGLYLSLAITLFNERDILT